MAENIDKTETPTQAEAPVAPAESTPKKGRQVSFTLPSMPRISLRNVAYRTKIAGLVAMLLLGLVGGYAGSWLQDRSSDGIFTATLGGDKKIVTQESQLVSTIAKNVGPSVVSVNVSVDQGTEQSDAYRRYFGLPEQQEAAAAGTGIIISKNGLVLTNRHVVPEGTTKVSITLSDGTELDNVKVVGRTSDTDTLDIAILKIEDTKGHRLTAATLGDSSKVTVGDGVVAIGNALGQFQNTITSGIISGYGRSIVAGSSSDSGETENLDNLFQTDAAINEGNSGGPLVNLNGQVIGVNTAIASDSQNIGFAIPINDVTGLIKQVIETGKFERPFLGVRYVSLTDDIAKQYGLDVTRGAYIAPTTDGSDSIVIGGAADKAGLKTGDVITKVAGQSVDQTNSLTSRLGRYQPGDKVELTVVNGRDTRTVTVTLGTAPAN
jgi:S1-C subfamily serine protease